MNEDTVPMRVVQEDLFEREALPAMRDRLQETREEVTRRCTWCQDDISLGGHSIYRTNCRYCGNLAARNHDWVRRQQDRRARQLAAEIY